MGSRIFDSASTNRIASSGTGISQVNHFQCAICTVSALPGAGARKTVVGLSSGTAARQCALQLDGDNSGSLACLVGATRMLPSTLMVPSTDGRWYLMGAYKPAGTVAVQFFMHDFSTGTWTEFNSAGTVANLTSNSTVLNIGSLGAAEYWSGRIGAVMHLGTWPYAAGGWRKLTEGRNTWFSLTRRAQWNLAAANGLMSFLFDLTSSRGVRDWIGTHGGGTLSVGTIPLFDAVDTPPGW